MDLNGQQANFEYIRPEEKIYNIVVDKNKVDWKSFLYELIHKEGLDPWDIDLSILTKRYLEAFREISSVDFDLSGKFLTIAVFLLKTKAENLVEKDLRGIEEKIASVQNMDGDISAELDMLEGFDNDLDDLSSKKSKGEYSLKIRNPIARKRKVNIFDLIKILEKTIEQSNKRRANFFLRHGSGKYDGPNYEKKPKDLKTLIEELYDFIMCEIGDKKAHVTFSHITKGINTKMGILERFIPLLHMHNNEMVEIVQKEHFGDIHIHKVNDKVNK